MFVIDCSVFFLTTEWFVPKLIINGKNYFLWLKYLLPIIFLSFTHYFLDYWFVAPLFPESHDLKYALPLYFVNVFWTAGISLGVGFTHHFYENQLKIKELELLKNKTELKLLLYKMNPHFLFNTLNNIYAHSITNSEETPSMILRLSRLMRHIIDNDSEYVSLKSELDFIKDYVVLEKMRHGPEIRINFEVHGNPEGLFIPKMLLIPFVENCFKHASADNIKDFYIHITIRIEEDKLTLFCENSTTQRGHENLENPKSGGFGLSAVRRKLELLYPPDDFLFHLKQESGRFTVQLQLPLKSRKFFVA
ncbi:MAG: histidine kinase [Flavobacteriales bacterium]|nr:histidine kinase [Flavobacteriales bacterium]MDW8409872.1 histidine kinase [Flavobacteriales bacterium]